MVNFPLGPLGLLARRETSASQLGGGHPAGGGEDVPDPLDLLIAALEALPDRKTVLARLNHGAPVSAKRGRNRSQAFVAQVARPYTSGVARPLFASEYPAHWPRFKALWDRLPVEKRDEAAG